MANTPVPGYPATGFGKKYHQVIDHDGPSAAAGGYPTGGEVIRASDFGMGGFDAVHLSGLSLSGTYFGRVVWPSASKGASFPTFKLMWFTQLTGLEVVNTTDLSGETMRFDLTMV